MKKFKALIIWMLALTISTQAQSTETDLGNKAYTLLNLPDLSKEKLSDQVVIAVIDDGFRLSHNALKNYFLVNQNEIPQNGIDDDANGYIDDVLGWDAADTDADVSVSEELKMDYYHGTMVSSIIAQVAERSLGPGASKHIKIMPIKALSDNATNTSMHKGYIGLEYAIKNGADIICMAWSGGQFDEKYAKLFQEARAKGILMLSAAGNFGSDQIAPPASLSGVFCVAAIDSMFRKLNNSNYGLKVDICASGDRVRAGHSAADNAYFSGMETSSAVSLITGGSAILKLLNPDARPFEIKAAIKNTSIPIEDINPTYNGRLGSGVPDFTKALDYLKYPQNRWTYFSSSRSEGDIIISKKDPNKVWQLESSSGTQSTHFILTSNRKTLPEGKVKFSTGNTIHYESDISNIDSEVKILGNAVNMEYIGKTSKKPVTFSYHTIPIDSTTMYCDEVSILDDLSGEFSDGSSDNPYANRVSCKWIINVPEGKNIQLDFDQLDTQANTDFIYLFHGDQPMQDRMFAKFSGNKLPPIVVSASNQVLIWFVTNESVTGQGWHLNYVAVDAESGAFPRVK